MQRPDQWTAPENVTRSGACRAASMCRDNSLPIFKAWQRKLPQWGDQNIGDRTPRDVPEAGRCQLQ